ncbi:MAG: efflux transporter outer membrane subunit [Holophagae bacterium]|jgi:NodT family efflux transporter outer membrane factor (OMF) lipoprotein
MALPPVLVVALLLGVVTACSVGPDYEPPEQPAMPDAWNAAVTDGVVEGTAPLETWWAVFDDPELTSLIERSRITNLTVREAVWRVEEARAIRGVTAGQRYPNVDATASAGRSQPSDNGPLGELAPDGFDAADLFDTGVGASWEIDLWGRVRRQVESADAAVDASVEDYRDVLVGLFAEVAANYVTVREQQDRLRLARANVVGQESTLQLTEDRFNAGLVSGLDIAQAESVLAATRSLIPVLERNRETSLNRLAVLLGTTPGALDGELVGGGKIPEEPDAITTGLPADLLRQRPDIRAAERRLASQTARIGVATADLYPQFSLTGFLGLQATDAGDLFSSDSVNWSVGLPIRWKLFAGGAVRSQIAVERARTEQLLAAYERTVLLALEEVEGAIIAYETELERRTRLAESVDATQRSLDLVLTQYRAGLTDFQNVLDTQRSLRNQQDDLAASEGLVIKNLISLYRALGGGWDPDAPEPQP